MRINARLDEQREGFTVYHGANRRNCNPNHQGTVSGLSERDQAKTTAGKQNEGFAGKRFRRLRGGTGRFIRQL